MRNPTYEQALNKTGITWRYEEKVPLDDINFAKGIQNQARLLEPLDTELVNDYAVAMKRGDDFPPVVLSRPGRGKWVPIDGNQRLAARQKVNHAVTDAYIVEVQDPKVIDRLTWTFNNLVNGKRLTKEECLEHAVSYVRKYGVTSKEAALEWGVNETSLRHRLGVERAREVLTQHDIKLTPSVSEEHLRSLKGLIDLGEDIFCEAFKVVASAGLTTSEADDLYRDIKRARTTEARMEVISKTATSDRVVARKAETKGGQTRIRPNAPREKYRKLVKDLDRILEDYEWKALQPLASEYKESRAQALRICQQLTRNYGLGTIPHDNTEVG